MIGELDMHIFAGNAWPEIEHGDGSRTPLQADGWQHARPGDASLIQRCNGPTLDVSYGPGRLTVALAEHGIPALGIDATPHAVQLGQASGGLTLPRDVFGRVPGTGRWMTVLLVDGNVGIGGDPAALLRRVSELLTPLGQALVELQPPGAALRRAQVRLRRGAQASAWFPWAYVGVDQIAAVADGSGLSPAETWSAADRWFAVLRPVQPAPDSWLPATGLSAEDTVRCAGDASPAPAGDASPARAGDASPAPAGDACTSNG